VNPKLGAGPRHPFRPILLAVVEVHRFRHAEFLNGPAKTILDDGLIHDRIERAVQNKPRRVVDERHQKHLLHGAAVADGQVRP
jgi:hypothetical protein